MISEEDLTTQVIALFSIELSSKMYQLAMQSPQDTRAN